MRARRESCPHPPPLPTGTCRPWQRAPSPSAPRPPQRHSEILQRIIEQDRLEPVPGTVLRIITELAVNVQDGKGNRKKIRERLLPDSYLAISTVGGEKPSASLAVPSAALQLGSICERLWTKGLPQPKQHRDTERVTWLL